MPIEDWISNPIASERHERVVPVDAERAVELALGMPAEGDRIVSMLVRLRGMRRGGRVSGGTMEDFFRANGFIELQRRPREVIFGIGAPAKIQSKERIEDRVQWRSWNRPGWIKAAATFQADPAGDGSSRLITETRVDATDETARRRFRRYWLVVGPFSALIRRRWLRQIAKAAAAEPAAKPG